MRRFFILSVLLSIWSHLAWGQYVVTNTLNSGAGSFPQAVLDANSDGVPSTITFNIPTSDAGYTVIDGNDTWTFFLTGVPNVNGGLVVDGSSQPGTGDIKIIFHGGLTREWIEYENAAGEDFEINNLKFMHHWSNIGGPVVRYRNGGLLRITDCVFELNRSNNNGGAVRIFDNAATVFITRSVFDANTAVNGGGAIVAETSGLLSFTDCTFEDNVAIGTNGGAVLNSGSHSYSISSSAFVRNSALFGNGGALTVNSSSHSMSNTTFSGNQALDGGAIYFNDPAMGFSITSSTFYNNRASNTGGGLFVQDGSVDLEHTVVAGNTPDDLLVGSGSINSDDYNLIGFDPGSVMTPMANDQVGTTVPLDPMLGSLQLNGGSTPNHLPLSGSPLVDAGNQADLFAPNDQRGFPRVDGTEADIGSVELEVSVSPHVYWTENLGNLPTGDDDIHRTDLEGNSFFQYYSGFSGEIAGLEMDTANNRLFWTDAANAHILYGVIGGSGFSAGPFTVIDFSPSGTNDLEDIALDLANSHVYFTHGNAETGFVNKVARVDIDGNNYQQLIDLGFEEPFGIDIDLTNNKLYFTTNLLGTGLDARLYRMNLDGSGLEELMYENTGFPYKYYRDVKIDPVNEIVYLSAGVEDTPGGEIFYNDLNEAAPFAAPSVFSFGGEPRGMDLDLVNNKLYWVCRGANDGATPPMIMRSDLDGNNIETTFTVTMFPSGYPPGPPGSAHIALDVRGAAPEFVNLTASTPNNNQQITVDGSISLAFDAPMSSASAAANIIVRGDETGIISGTFTGDGTNTLVFDPDNDFRAGEYIRVSIESGLQSTSDQFISSDHHLTLRATSGIPPESPAFFREAVPISGGGTGTWRVIDVADIDTDGDLDVVSGQQGLTDQIAWHENDGLQNLGFDIIEATNFDIESIDAGDIDSDGDIDFLRTNNGAMYWHENDGNENFSTIFINQLGTGAGNPSAILRDVDSDGDLDVVSCWTYTPFSVSRVWWAENDGSEGFTKYELPISIVYPLEVEALDLNSDGHMDIVAFNNAEIAWYLNDGNQNFAEYKLQTGLTAQFAGGEVADFNGDGAMDFLISTTVEILWFENDGAFGFSSNLISSSGNDFIATADVDGDGDVDFFGGEFGFFHFYDNNGSGSFTRRQFSASNNSIEHITAVDFDQDGDIDALAGGNTSGARLMWFENTTIIPSAPEIAVFVGNDNSGTPVLDGQASPVNFGSGFVGSPIDVTFAIENTGTSILSIGSIGITGASFTVIGAPSSVGVGATETFTIQLSGASTGSFSETVTITNNDADEGSFTFPVTGTISAAPEAVINVYEGSDNSGPAIFNGQPNAIDFGTGIPGSDIDVTFAIENTGTLTLLITGINVSGTAFSIGPAPASVGVGITETFTITLSETSEGTFSESVTINNNDSDLNPFTFPVTGTISSTQLPEINVYVGPDNTGAPVSDDQTTAIDLGTSNVGTDLDQIFTIENSGTADLSISGITSTGSPEVSFSGTLPTNVSAGATQTFTIQISGATAGTFTADVQIASNDANEASFDFPVTGVILTVPVPNLQVFTNQDTPVQLSDNDLISMGNSPVGADPDTTITIENSGTLDLVLSAVNSSDNAFSVNGNVGTIMPGLSENFTITLDGTNPGSYSGTLTISSNDPDESVFVLNLSGTIEQAQIILIDASDTTQLQNGQTNPVTGSTQEFVPFALAIAISNPGNIPLNIQSVTIDNPVFTFSNVPTSVAAGATVTFTIEVDERITGTHDGLVTVLSDLGSYIFPVQVTVQDLPAGVVIFNAVSPNGDGRHDFLRLQGIEAYPNSTLYVYNKVGTLVYQQSGYTNSDPLLRFQGAGNQGSFEELAAGTYYYMIDLKDGSELVKGYFVLNR